MTTLRVVARHSRVVVHVWTAASRFGGRVLNAGPVKHLVEVAVVVDKK